MDSAEMGLDAAIGVLMLSIAPSIVVFFYVLDVCVPDSFHAQPRPFGLDGFTRICAGLRLFTPHWAGHAQIEREYLLHVLFPVPRCRHINARHSGRLVGVF